MTSKVILLAGLFAIITAKFSPAQDTPTPATGERDPITSFQKLIATFPKRSIRKSTKTAYDIVNVTFDVKKTDSLINPIIGIINFTTDETLPYPADFHKSGGVRIQLDMQMVFHWQGDHWTFERILNRKNGVDFTHNEDLWGTGAMSDFLKSLQ